jgi:hypothetical protein
MKAFWHRNGVTRAERAESQVNPRYNSTLVMTEGVTAP